MKESLDWNATHTDYPRQATIQQMFEEQVARGADLVAASWDDVHLTYRQLNRRANQLAHYLRQRGVGPATLVAICVERSLDMVVGLLGILKAGGAYLPLDPTYPRERTAFMLADAQTPVLLTQQHLLDSLPPHAAHTVCLDTDWPTIAGERTDNPPIETGPQHPAYVMYTSGSTGRPKGIVIPQQAVNRLVFNTNYITLQPGDRIAQVSNVAFDAATFEIWGALLHGGRLVGLDRETILSPQEFARQLCEQGIDAMFLTAALFNQVARQAPGAFRSMKTLMAGGEALDPRWIRTVLAHQPPQRLLNGYGPTESTTFAAWYPIQAVAQDATSVPIGYPLSNTQLYVLDDHLQPVPIGVIGELYIGGEGLAWGYLNRPALTAECFIPNPFARDPGQRLYRTGDLARILPGGAIDYQGRVDFQVKVRGFRIELGEIEAVLGQHPAVCDVVVLAREDMPGERRLVAYLVPTDGAAPSPGSLRRFLGQKLPDYMIPAAFVSLDALPLTPNGKIDRQALPLPARMRPTLTKDLTAPRNPVERELVAIWEEILQLQGLGIDDNFFELGGHSLLATQVVARIRSVFKVNLSLRTFFQGPTIADLAAFIQQTPDRPSQPAEPALIPVARAGRRVRRTIVKRRAKDE